MQITAICNPLTGIKSADVAQIFQDQWLRTRAERKEDAHKDKDHVCTIQSTHGRMTGDSGTGLAPVLFTEIGWSREECTLLDFAQTASWNGEGVPVASSYPLGVQLREALLGQPQRLWIHLPRFSKCSDLGLGLLAAFIPDSIPEREDFCADDFNYQTLEELSSVVAKIRMEHVAAVLLSAFTRLRQLTQDLSATITYSEEQPLFGFSGIAKSWTNYGVSAQSAQQAEALFGEISAFFEKSFASRMLLGAPKQMSSAGTGGGLGFLFNSLGFQVRDLALQLAENEVFWGKMRAAVSCSDAVFYLCEPFGAQIPQGFINVSDLAAEFAVPLVLMSESSGIRRGDLPRLGLAGNYDLNPEIYLGESCFSVISDARSAGEMTGLGAQTTQLLQTTHSAQVNISALSDSSYLHRSQLLREMTARCARTWGW